MPLCGIGADEITKLVAGDPFGKWASMSACIKDIMKENPDYTKEQAAATCVSIEKKSKAKKDMFREVLENMKNEIDMVLSKFDDIEEDAGAPKTEAERAMTHFNISEEKWSNLSEEEKQEYISKLPPRGEGLKKDGGELIIDKTMSDEDLSGLLSFYTLTEENWATLLDETRIVLRSLYTERSKVYKGTDPETMAGGEKPVQDPELTGDEVIDDCPDCEDDEEAVKQLAADLSLEDIDKKQETSPGGEPKPDGDESKVKVVPFVPTKSVEELLKRHR